MFDWGLRLDCATKVLEWNSNTEIIGILYAVHGLKNYISSSLSSSEWNIKQQPYQEVLLY